MSFLQSVSGYPGEVTASWPKASLGSRRVNSGQDKEMLAGLSGRGRAVKAGAAKGWVSSQTNKTTSCLPLNLGVQRSGWLQPRDLKLLPGGGDTTARL